MAAQAEVSSRPLAYIDLDIGDARAEYGRCCHFVETNDLKYALTSKRLSELGGREILSLPELYAHDYEWSAKGACRAKPQPNCRVVVEVYDDVAPLAAENFLALVRGDRGTDKGSGVPLTYVGCPFHRVVRGFVAQGGDIVKGNGSGGASVYGKKFKDEARGLKLKHDARGVLSMGNSGKNANSSQFFFTFDSCPALDGKHVVFGRVVEGFDVLDALEAVAPVSGEAPVQAVRITACGLFVNGETEIAGHWAPPSAASHQNAPPVFVAPPPTVLVAGPPLAVAKTAAAFREAKFDATVAPFAGGASAAPADGPRGSTIVLVAPNADDRDRNAAEAVAKRFSWPLVRARPAVATEPVRAAARPRALRR